LFLKGWGSKITKIVGHYKVERRIIRLEESVISRICAGEVVERPSSAIKELIENSIDAGADSIEVEILSEDFLSFRVKDNGCGMKREEIRISVERWTTSKLKKEEDLLSISTYGFRGEALYSIAAVSRLIIRSAESDGEGYECYFEGGELMWEKPVSMRTGTTVEVHELFFNSPVRKRFLRGRKSELFHTTELIFKYAMAIPDISYRLRENERDIVNIEKGMTLKSIFENLFGRETKGFEINFEDAGIEISGYLSHPDSPPLYRRLYLIVNRRPVESGIIKEAIKSGFERSIEKGRAPSGIIKIEISPDEVDVNIHPQKRTIKFKNQEFVDRAIAKSIKAALSRKTKEVFYIPPPGREEEKIIKKEEVVREKVQPPLIEDFPKVIGNLWNEFMLLERESALLLIDVHAAHEKIIYDRLKEEYESEEPAMTLLLTPIVLNVGKTVSFIENLLKVFENLGFLIEIFGREDVCIRGYPAVLDEDEVERTFKEILNSLLTESPIKAIEKLASIACKKAVKSGKQLSNLELITLLDDLKEIKSGAYCPHGRPIIYIIEKKEILKWFMRR
jgi:DNA mismatch repair protein MutL